MGVKKMKYNKYIDHTLLKADATKAQIDQLIEEAIKYDFASVCVQPTWVKYCASRLKDTDVLVCTVIGFPLGANTTAVKVYETQDAIQNGANEIDMVINIGALKDGNVDLVSHDIESVVQAANPCIVKVIIETCLLTKEEIVLVCQLAKEAKATFVKTSTGFSTGGATLEVVELMKKTVGEMAVKASGGVRDYETLVKMVEIGASRIGTSSGVLLMEKQVIRDETY